MNSTASEATVQIFDGANSPARLQQRSIPARLSPGELLVKIRLATICGSDLHTMSGHRQEPTPLILGHEAVGAVVAVGGGRRDIAVGDRITWSIADSCGHCPACTEHALPQKCRSLFKYGHASVDDGTGLNGCYASHIVLRPGTHVVPIPKDLPDSIVAPANCALATVMNAVSKLPSTCRTVVVQGAGLLGIYSCAVLAERGVEHIFCVDIQEKRLQLVAHFGAEAIDGRPEHYGSGRQKVEAIAPGGVDAVLEMAGTATVVPEGIRLLRPGGMYALVGLVHPQSRLQVTGEQIIRKCLTVYGVHNYAPAHLEQAITFLESTALKYPYHQLVSPPYALENLEDAIRAARTPNWHRVSIRPNDSD